MDKWINEWMDAWMDAWMHMLKDGQSLDPPLPQIVKETDTKYELGCDNAYECNFIAWNHSQETLFSESD